MTARPVFVKLAAFFFAFAAAVALVGVLRNSWPARRVTSCGVTPPRPFKLTEDLGVEVGLVTLDREHARSYTRLTLAAYRGRAPEKLRVRTYFFAPDDEAGRVWAGDAVEISRPFDRHGSVNLTVAAPCDWCDDETAPRGGYFARVQISDGREETPLPQGAEFRDIKTAVPVVVHAERVPIPRR
jgi:hypothetical protein